MKEKEIVKMLKELREHFKKKRPNSTEEEIEHMFVDTLKMFSIYPASLGGDFDGDQVSVQGIFSDEANAEAIKQMNNVSHFVGLDGSVMRTLPLGVRHGLHCLTYKNRKTGV